MYPDAWYEYMKFPEVLFIDATHSTNNESRPLLLLCGHDANGKVFIIMQIFMPNETAAFFRWVFLDAIPSMLGRDNLSRTKLMTTDGNSQEATALDESIYVFLNQQLETDVVNTLFIKHKK